MKKRAASLALAALSAAALAACTDSGEGERDANAASEPAVGSADVLEALNQSAQLEAELYTAEARIIQQCMEDQGFTVHDQNKLAMPPATERSTLVDYYPHAIYLPETADAQAWGFGQWTTTEDSAGSPEAADYFASLQEGAPEEWVPPENGEWDALSPDERYEWYLAYYGEEKGAVYGESFLNPAADLEDMEAEGPAGGEDGELDFGEDASEEIRPGGCELAMIEALYGEPERSEDDEGNVTWTFRPESPLGDEFHNQNRVEYGGRIAEPGSAFLDCVAERGHTGWTFDDGGNLPVADYWLLVYHREELVGLMEGETVPGMPEHPEDMPEDYEGQREYEIEMAVDFAECGDETGFREAAATAWEELLAERYQALEQDLYAWQDEMRTALDRAQDVLGG